MIENSDEVRIFVSEVNLLVGILPTSVHLEYFSHLPKKTRSLTWGWMHNGGRVS